jgi:hypothetical protein
MQFKIGDYVIWTSQAGARSKTKTGIITQVVPPLGYPDPVAYPQLHASGGLCRREESYVVVVGKKPYWPRVKHLKNIVLTNSTRYQIIDRKTSSGFQLTEGRSVGAYLLGKRVSEYIIIKSDMQGDRIVHLTSYDATDITVACEEA